MDKTVWVAGCSPQCVSWRRTCDSGAPATSLPCASDPAMSSVLHSSHASHWEQPRRPLQLRWRERGARRGGTRASQREAAFLQPSLTLVSPLLAGQTHSHPKDCQDWHRDGHITGRVSVWGTHTGATASDTGSLPLGWCQTVLLSPLRAN